MDKKLDITNKLDFNDIDLTAPNDVVQQIIKELSSVTNNIVHGKIKEYDGHVVSYTKPGLSGIAEALGTVSTRVDIQEDLGRSGIEEYKYEFYLFTPKHKYYKFRVCFLRYYTGNYPVTITLEENVAKSISSNNIIKCNSRVQLEETIYKILNSKYVIEIMQEIIRLYQISKDNIPEENEAGSTDT